MRFTVGMPTFDDFDGAYFTLQALWLYHQHRLEQVIIIDNNPGTRVSKRLQDLAAKAINTRYVPFNDIIGTAPAKGRVFTESKSKYTVCIDSHILLAPGALDALAKYYESNPDSKALVFGSMLTDNHNTRYASLSSEFGDDIRGKWQTPTPEQMSRPWYPLRNAAMGLFACRTDGWLGFNPAFRGFGGEEWYLPTKYLKAGREVIGVRDVLWMHRFSDQTAPKPYPLTMYDRARNYYLGAIENGEDVNEYRDHYVGKGFVNPELWQNIVDGKERPCPTGNCGGGGTAPFPSAAAWHELNVKTPGDLNEHLPTLAALAKDAVVVDCGDRQSSTVPAFIAGGAKQVTTVAGAKFRGFETAAGFGKLAHVSGNSLTAPVETFAGCDLLFLDTEPHHGPHVYEELKRLAPSCRHYIVLHDTVIFGEKGQNNAPGIMAGIRQFVRDNSQWTVIKNYLNNNGLAVLSCNDEDKKKLPTLGRRILNFGGALFGHVKAGRPVTAPADMEARRAVCDTCEYRNDDHCGQCGCPLEERASYRELGCPLGRWPLPMLPPVG